ncbi:phage major tropism determinant [Fodinicurvata sediminis]|uniref:phage major tropism determinant n=1 Tax=Fodinicurvata sediminis TaxID=1121832 RepID=UPI0012DE7522|nr:hypothetical protein [Fodinicurvata sediminis]
MALVKRAVPADGPGHINLMGRLAKGTGDTLDIPAGIINVGGAGEGFRLASATDWDPTANDDGTVTALALGDDVYIYAVQDSSGTAGLVASKNATYPDGYTADNSRKLGGFHYGRVRPLSDRYSAGATLPVQIVPNSVWDLKHRPTCDPTGMVEIWDGGPWIDIYLNSADGATWPDTMGLSVYDAAPVRNDNSPYAVWDFYWMAANAGKRLAMATEMMVAAYGIPGGAQGGSGPNNTGDDTGYGFEAVSCKNIDQPSGALWHVTWDIGNTDGSYNGTSQGQDSAFATGSARHHTALTGGTWADGSTAGARCSHYGLLWFVGGLYGFRAACDPL